MLTDGAIVSVKLVVGVLVYSRKDDVKYGLPDVVFGATDERIDVSCGITEEADTNVIDVTFNVVLVIKIEEVNSDCR